ncbi:MAG: hypothetical protein IK092_03715, partial [Muribaculaceae bacterium]|nr:hypothetical protein [Muribaculaceae bacterium]
AVREVVVKPLILGDVDDDGVVGVTDVTWLINMCLDIIPGDITLGDMNGDGELTVIDVTLLISKILSN